MSGEKVAKVEIAEWTEIISVLFKSKSSSTAAVQFVSPFQPQISNHLRGLPESLLSA
jgi:hypothetical protein